MGDLALTDCATFVPSIRKAIRAELERRRQINIEAKALRARLKQLAADKAVLSTKTIAERHGVPPLLVLSIANQMTWMECEKPPQQPLPPYDAYHAR